MTAVELLETNPVWMVLFWGTVLVRLAIEVRNSGRNANAPRTDVDGGSRALLRQTIMIGNFVAYFVAFRVPAFAMPGPGAVYLGSGIALMWLGIGLRQWAVHTLGRFFTFTVAVHDEHSVVTGGPYRVVRHPSYSGGTLSSIGTGIALGNWLALLIVVLVPLAGVVNRIKVEERAMVDGIGPAYAEYAARRKRLVPFVW
jgi:protein-S-isoprenylcysteine O-methyltransferase Ste14